MDGDGKSETPSKSLIKPVRGGSLLFVENKEGTICATKFCVMRGFTRFC